MTENKKKLRQQPNLWQVFELCGSIRLPCHIALSPVGSGHITADKRLGSCRASPKFSLRSDFVYPQTLNENFSYFYGHGLFMDLKTKRVIIMITFNYNGS